MARGAFWFVIVAGRRAGARGARGDHDERVGLSLLVFLPRLVVGAVILLVGIGAARFLERSVLIGAVNQRIRQARLLALAVKWFVLVLAAAMALEHVGVGGGLPTIAFAIVVGGIVLAVALAVGLGARDAVARALDATARPEARPRRAAPPRTSAGPAPLSRRPCRPCARDRRSGILLHPTSLPGPHGVGRSRRRRPPLRGVARRGAASGSGRCCPLGPTGFGDSPYQALSSRAGNPLLVSLEVLRNEGWLDDADLAGAPGGRARPRGLRARRAWRRDAARARGRAFPARAGAERARPSSRRSARARRSWLEDWALFSVLKDAHGGPPVDALARAARPARAGARSTPRAPATPRRSSRRCSRSGASPGSGTALRARCRALGIALIGDLPIYVAHDSVEVWSRPELFRLDARGEPAAVAGVPPDYFSATGQRWGNPLYDWEAVARDGWRFWIDARPRRARAGGPDPARPLPRVRGVLGDPGGRADRRGGPLGARARRGAVRGARARARAAALHRREPRRHHARGGGAPAHGSASRAWRSSSSRSGTTRRRRRFRPHNYERDTVAYTGTHDNDTVMGWWEGGAGEQRPHRRGRRAGEGARARVPRHRRARDELGR